MSVPAALAISAAVSLVAIPPRSHIASGTSLSHGQQMLVQFFHHINKFGFRILMRIVGKQSIDIRKKDQKIGTYHSGNHCGPGYRYHQIQSRKWIWYHFHLRWGSHPCVRVLQMYFFAFNPVQIIQNRVFGSSGSDWQPDCILQIISDRSS